MDKAVSTQAIPSEWSPDRPLTDISADELGFAEYARHLADTLCTRTPDAGLVVAIYGSWGCGKTTVLNFVERFIEQKPQSERPHIVHFNPWWFAGHEDLVRRFFAQLESSLLDRSAASKQLRDRIAVFAEAVAEIPLPYASAGKLLGRIIKCRAQDVAAMKSSLADALKDVGRILIIVDDIDRLPAEDTRQVFRLLKAVGDFPNCTYLLAMDRAVVAEALTGLQGVSGEGYLEKIVQVPLDMPPVDRPLLRQYFFARLSALLCRFGMAELDQTYWGNVFFEGIDHFIQNVRDVTRLTNALLTAYPAAASEVNLVDFIAMETLRVFAPQVYAVIRDNPGSFTGGSGSVSGATGETARSFHEKWVGGIPESDRKAVKDLLLRLFPRLASVWGNTSYDTSREATWRKHRRVCSSHVFPFYFSQCAAATSVTSAEMKAALAVADDAGCFGQLLLRLADQKMVDGTSRARAFLERLEDYTAEDIALEEVASVVEALFHVGDKLIRPEDARGIFSIGNETRIARVIYQLLRRLERPERFEVLKSAAGKAQSVAILVRIVMSLGQQLGRRTTEAPWSDDKCLLDAGQVDALEIIARDKIREAAEATSFIVCPLLSQVLYAWRQWGGDEEPREWVQGLIQDDAFLVLLLSSCAQETSSQSVDDVVCRTRTRLDPEWFAPYFDASSVIDRVRDLAAGQAVAGTQAKAALDEFIREYELRQRGIDPDSADAWER